MIVVSVLLILVAVTLLVLGVAGGSSTLLISSIVASLMAAIALVAGARQAAAMRRAAAPVPEPLDADIHAGPGPDLPVAEPAGAATPDAGAASDTPPMADADTPAGRSGHRAWIPTGRRGRRRRRGEATPEPLFADNPLPSDEGLASPTDTKPRIANREDAEAALAADEAYRAGAEAAAPISDDDPDYHRASSVIGSARSGSPEENAWRRAADDGGSGPVEEFAEPDADDPDDEPLPQAVRPEDAVRIARMPAEVLVVDGRPRYHMADCPHLVGKLTEPLPVAEAVELGFSPCGLCRPVDRLVARAAQF
jgi:hypothetical protein